MFDSFKPSFSIDTMCHKKNYVNIGLIISMLPDGPSTKPLPEQFCLVINEILCNLSEGNFTPNTQDINHYNLYLIYIFEIMALYLPGAKGLKHSYFARYVAEIYTP